MLKKQAAEKLGEDASDPLLFDFKLLTIAGCWEIPTKVTWKRFLYMFHQYFARAGMVIIPILQIFDIIEVRHDIEKLCYNLSASCGTIMLIFKMIIFLSHQESLKQIQKEFRNNFNLPYLGKTKQDQEIIKVNDDANNRFQNIYFFGLGLPTVTTWSIIPLLDKSGEKKLTPFSLWYPFDYEKSPIYEIMWIYQVYMLYMYSCSIIPIDLIYLSLMNKICAHFELINRHIKVLGSKLKDQEGRVVSKQEEEEMHLLLQRIVRHHQLLLRQCQTIEKMYKNIVFIHFCVNAMLMCTEIFDIVFVTHGGFTLRMATQIQYFGASIVDTYLDCYYGNRIIDRCQTMTQDLYDIPWYNMSARCKKMVLLMLMKTQNAPYMTGGGLFVINLETFLNVCKNSYNILALLNHMKDK